jgi:hypothetical protein
MLFVGPVSKLYVCTQTLRQCDLRAKTAHCNIHKSNPGKGRTWKGEPERRPLRNTRALSPARDIVLVDRAVPLPFRTAGSVSRPLIRLSTVI